MDRQLCIFRDKLGFALGFLFAAIFVLAAATAAAFAAETVVDTITVKFRDHVATASDLTLPDAIRSALYDALQMPFVQVGGTRDGAFRLEP